MLIFSGFSFLLPPKNSKYCSLKGINKGPIFKNPFWVPETCKILIYNNKNHVFIP